VPISNVFFVCYRAIGEAAYKAAVQAAGKNQKSLTIGWEVLGLTKESATRIFKEEADTGFELDRVTMYKGQTTKYDRKGNIISKDEAAKAAEKGDDSTGVDNSEDLPMPTSNVMVCGNCGFTLFIAKGREAKFFGPGFKCPECGASKDQFAPPEDDEE
jgi:rubredoxin